MVDRYCIDSGDRPQGDLLLPNEYGPLVRWADYDALAARLAQAERLLAGATYQSDCAKVSRDEWWAAYNAFFDTADSASGGAK
jgi:hypothetical protein